MSLDRSLKTKPAGLNQHRNVLTRAERVAKLSGDGEFDLEKDSPLHLPKVAHRMAVAAKKKKAEGEGGDADADGAATEAAADGETEAEK